MKLDSFDYENGWGEVAPYAGAWIEILYPSVMHSDSGSLPTRERGLKLAIAAFHFVKDGSLPTRERGLKSHIVYFILIQDWSLPTRERGLKYAEDERAFRLLNVAPYAGAWIEICHDCIRHPISIVAPYAGAWIEIPALRMTKPYE